MLYTIGPYTGWEHLTSHPQHGRPPSLKTILHGDTPTLQYLHRTGDLLAQFKEVSTSMQVASSMILGSLGINSSAALSLWERGIVVTFAVHQLGDPMGPVSLWYHDSISGADRLAWESLESRPSCCSQWARDFCVSQFPINCGNLRERAPYWSYETVFLPSSATRLAFRATSGTLPGERPDSPLLVFAEMALDDIVVSTVAQSMDLISCDFEDGACGWSGINSREWRRTQKGAGGLVPAEGLYYLVVEASAVSDKVFSLTSPLVSSIDSSFLSFAYYLLEGYTGSLEALSSQASLESLDSLLCPVKGIVQALFRLKTRHASCFDRLYTRVRRKPSQTQQKPSAVSGAILDRSCWMEGDLVQIR